MLDDYNTSHSPTHVGWSLRARVSGGSADAFLDSAGFSRLAAAEVGTDEDELNNDFS